MAVRNHSLGTLRYSPLVRFLPLILILFAALGLRLSGINWDDAHLFHPDERYILMVAEKIALPNPLTLDSLFDVDNPLNPHSFAYGSFPFYLLRGVSALLGWLGSALAIDWLARLSSFEGMRLVGRALSALFDTATVFLVYLFGRKIWGHWTGVLAAAFVAFAVLHVQLSHFFASDPILAFFVLLTLYSLVGVYRSEGARWPAITGLALGLALATKVSAAPILAAVGLVYLGRVFTREVDGAPEADGRPRLVWRERWVPQLSAAIADGFVTLGVALVTFLIAEPYAVIDFATFAKNVGEQNAMASGTADLPYTRQFANRPLYLYFLQNLTVFGLGVPLALAAFGGTLLALARAIRRPRLGDLLLIVWIVPYFAITGGFHAKFLRYLLPIIPALCLFGAVGVMSLGRWRARVGQARIGESTRVGAYLAAGVAAVVVASSLLYSVAYDRIYTVPHTAVAASRWIYDNVPARSVIATEHWDEGMPLPLIENGRQTDAGQRGYRTITLNLYDDDNEAKLTHIVQQLDQADYIVLFSNRLYGTIPRLPKRYPMTSEYYRLLFGEKLGYQLVGAFESYPNLFGVTFADDTLAEPGLPTPALLAARQAGSTVVNLGHADESYSVYDHPKVLVFKRTERLTAAQVRTALRPYLASGPVSAPPSAPTYRSLLLTAKDRAVDTLGGTFRGLFDPSGLGSRFPVATWVGLVELLGLAASPLLFAVCRSLADRGYFLAKTLGMLLLAWLVWMPVSLGAARATRELTFGVFAGLLIAGGIAAYLQRRSLAEHLRTRWRGVAVAELVFWVAFAVFLVIRMANPDLWHPARGGEKPMDLAYLTATIKSETYPPYDPWFAGGYLNYYYFGQLIVGTLIKLAGIVPTTAYNLAVPTLFALTLVGAFGIAYNLIGEQLGPRRAAIGGAFAAVFVGVIGNLGGAQQLVNQVTAVGGLQYNTSIPLVGETARLLYGAARVFGGSPLPIGTDWYWASTRVIPGTINEFPFFTFLFADLHAHLIGLPFTLLALGLALNVALAKPAAGRFAPWGGVARSGASLALLALGVGALYPVNSWDYPTYLGIAVLALATPVYLSSRRSVWTLLGLAVRVSIVVALSYLLFLPFHQSFQSFYSGVVPHSDRSTVNAYLLIHGFLLAGLGTFVVADASRRFARNGSYRTIGQLACWWTRLPRLLRLRRHFVRVEDPAGVGTVLGAAVVLIVGLALARFGLPLVGLLVVLLAIVAFLALQRQRSADELFLYVIFGTGLALGIATELVAIDGDVGRMNTVFKFYLQVWVLWGIGAAVAIAKSWDWLHAESAALAKQAWLGLLALLFVGCLVYPIIATGARIRDRFDNAIAPTLDGTAYMLRAVYQDESRQLRLANDLAAIGWLQQNVSGSPVVLEGNTPLYRWGSRVSIYTGLPTVIGWDWHQKQQRWGYQNQVEERLRDVRTLYTDTSIPRTVELLNKYQVRYIYLGDLERGYYPGPGLSKFDQMVGQQLDLVYDSAGVRIYRVRVDGGQ